MNPARISLVARSAARSLNVQRRSFAVLAREPTAASVVTPPVGSSYSPLQEAIAAKEPRNNWTKAEIESIYNTGTLELAFAAVRSRLSPCMCVCMSVCVSVLIWAM